MKTLLAINEDFIKLERGVLAADVAAGSNVTVNVGNNNGLAQNDYIVIGHEGSDQAELEQINAAVSAGTSVQVAAVKFAHKAGEPWVKYRFNKRKFYGSTTATGVFTELVSSGSPADIQVDDPQGARLEYIGNEGYSYFKATYFNSTTDDETDLADAEAVLADESARYCSLYAIRKQAGLTNNPFITDLMIETYRKRSENEVNSAIFNRYTLPLAEIPAVIENATTLLAAGYLDYQEFGKDGEGVKWLGEGRGILKALSKGTQRLIGADGTELATKSRASTVQSYPDQVDNTNGPKQWFSMDQTF